MPVLVTLHMAKTVWHLRSSRSFRRMKRAIEGGKSRFGTRIIHFSVQGNHVHLIVETEDAESLGRAMKGLGVRIARRMNAMMQRRGRVIGDRYHASLLRSHRAAHRAIRYVRENHRKHFAPKDDWRKGTTTDFFSSWARHFVLPRPTTRALVWASEMSERFATS